MPDDERKGRRLGDETKGRIADLASGWTVDGDAAPVPEPPIRREASTPAHAPRDAPRRKAKTLPPPPPGSAARKALEDKIVELREVFGEPEAPELPRPPTLPAARPPPVPRPKTGKAPTARRPRARSADPIDLTTLPEADRTQENRGAVGINHDKSASLTTNAASGTIGGDTPAPIFDRAAIAAGQRGALAGEPLDDPPTSPDVRPDAGNPRVAGTGSAGRLGSAAAGDPGPRRTSDRIAGKPSPVGTGPSAAIRDTPNPGALDRPPLSPPAAPAASRPPGNDSGPAPDAVQRLVVPLGEFDEGQTVLEPDKRQIAHAQATIKRDAAGALLGLAEPAPGPPPDDTVQRMRGDATWNDTSGSSGQYERGDATALSPPATGHAPTGTLRTAAALPRTRGLAGDVRYVATVILGVREARRELAALAARQDTRQHSRRHHLVTLGRAAVTAAGFDHPALGAARDQLSSVEDERSQHAGHVIAADAELTRVRRDRDARAQRHAAELAALDGELAGLVKQLEPLEKEAAGIKKRGIELHESLRRIDAKIAATEASLDPARGGKLDRAQIQAEIATLRADRRAIQSDEPAIAGQLDALDPRIAALEAARSEAQRKRAEAITAEHDDQRRVEELLAAIGAKRKVVDRAAADAEALRDKILFQLGERLYVDRPDDLTAELAPIDEIDLELGSADRRMMELREIVASVDRWKLVRGIALIAAVLAVVAVLAGWLLGIRP